MARTIDDFWKILKEIQGTSTDLTDSIKAIAKNEKTVSETLFTNIIDQMAYNSADYQRMRSFLRDWYAAHRSLTKFQANVSDIYQIPNDQLDELFQSFGYNYSTSLRNPITNNPPPDKINFFLDLVNLYKIKGTPQALLNVLQYYGVTDLDLYELSLQFDDRVTRSSDDLIFKGKVITGTTGDTSPIYLPFDLLTENDPHWLQSESTIKTLFDLRKINFPSQSPYFVIKPLFDEEAIDATTGILKRKVQDQFTQWQTAGYPPEDTNPVLSQDAIISITGDQCSLLTLYLACVYTFNLQYNVGSPAERFICYDGSNTNAVDIINEFRTITAKPSSRADQRERYIQYLDTFSRHISFSFLQNHSDAEAFLTVLNPTVKSNIDNLATDINNTLGTLLKDLGEWARTNISYGFINMGYILFGIDSLFSDLRNVVEFFKPYRARIVPLEMLQLKNRLLNSIVVEDSFEIGVDVDFHDYLVGDSIPCCTDATCSSIVGPREYYDCGSYHDIGAITDKDRVEITLDDTIHDRLMCPVGCKERQSANVISGKSFVDVLFVDYPLDTDYTIITNVYNLIDDNPSIIPHIITAKSLEGFRVQFADTIDSENYYVTWDIITTDQTSNFGITPIPNGVDTVSVVFSNPESNPNYTLNIVMENVDDSKQDFFLYTITNKTINGFTIKFSDLMSNSHYRFSWSTADYGKESTYQDGLFHIPYEETVITVPLNCPCELCSNYNLALSIVNTDDPTPSQYGYVIIEKASEYFKLLLSGPADSDNYYLSWTINIEAQSDPGYVVSEILSGIQEFQTEPAIIENSFVEVVFPSPRVDSNYVIISNLYNIVDYQPDMMPHMITQKTNTGFVISFSDDFKTENYRLNWDVCDQTNSCGVTPIPNGANEVSVVFSTPFDSTTNYSLDVSMENLVDPDPSYFAFTVINKTSNGFSVRFSEVMPDGNYTINWKTYDYGRDVSVVPQSGYTPVPINSTAITIPFQPPYENYPQYSVALCLGCEDSTNVSQYSYMITEKNIYGFTVTFSSPIDSNKYYISWNQFASSIIIFDEFKYRQTGQMRDFDEEGTFDCTYGFDQCDIEVITYYNLLLQENGYNLLLETEGGIYI